MLNLSPRRTVRFRRHLAMVRQVMTFMVVALAVPWGASADAQPVCWQETTLAEFGDGVFDRTEVVGIGDGAVQLQTLAGFSDVFDEPDGPASSWLPWPASGNLSITPTWFVSGQVYVHDYNSGASTYHPSVLDPWVVTGDFSLTTRQRIADIATGGLGLLGFVIGGADIENYYIVQWTVGQGAVKIYRRSTGGAFSLVGEAAAPDPVLGQWHELRIDVTGTVFEVFTDGQLRLSTSDAGYVPGRVGLLGYQGSLNEYDDVVLTGDVLALNGVYASSTFDTGGLHEFLDLSWVGSAPAGTTVGLETRTSLDGVAWSSWQPVGIGGEIANPDGQYVEYRVDFATTDPAANPLVEQVEICYQPPPPPPCFLDETTADFALGSFGAGTYLAEAGDGEVTLAPTEGAEFFGTSLPVGWSVTPWTGSSSAVVGGGALTVEQANVGPDAVYGSGRSAEFVTTFEVEVNQHVGFGTTFSSTPWAMFSTGSDGTTLKARSWAGPGNPFIDEVIGAEFLGTPHRYRVDWNADGTVDFSIDGTPVATHTVTILDDMSIRISDIQTGPPLVVDWIRMSEYAGVGGFESRIYDAGAISDWNEVIWSSVEPTGTSLAVSVRSGNTPIPDGTWTAYAPILASGDPLGQTAQFIQYRADLATTDGDETPVLLDLGIRCDLGVDTSPPFVIATDPTDQAIAVFVGTDITIDYNEPINPATFTPSISGGVAFTTSFLNGDQTVVLDPVADLEGLTLITVTVAAGLEDLAGNATPSPYSFDFTTAERECVRETTTADFADGTFQDTAPAAVGDGAVILASVDTEVELLDDTFSEPDGPASNWTPLDGTWNVVGGEYDFTIGASYAASIISDTDTGGSLNALGSYTLESRQKIISFGSVGTGGYVWNIQNPTGAEGWKNGSYMVQWDTRAGTLQNVRIFRWDGPTSLTLLNGADIADVIPNTWYVLGLRVDGPDFEVSVDGVPVLSASDATYGPGAIALVGWWDGDTRYDDVVLRETQSGFAPAGTYASSAFDAGTPTEWLTLGWTGSEPAGTTVSFETRTSSDGIGWSAWEAAGPAGSIVSPAGAFVAYRASLTTVDPGAAPVIESVRLTCAPCTATPPDAIGDLVASQVKDGDPAGAGPSTTAIELVWSPVEVGDTVTLYRKAFGDYPEYDDGTGSVPAVPADPAAAVGDGWAPVVVGLPTATTDAPAMRDYWYYVAFVTDPCGNISGPSNLAASLSYHLGDVADGSGGPGNNLVGTEDVSLLGAHYGTVDGDALYDPVLDVGPTEDFSTDARPLTDDRIGFEDLMMFLINYGAVAKQGSPSLVAMGAGNRVTLSVPTELPGLGETLEVGMWMQADGSVRGMSLPLTWNDDVVRPTSSRAGELLQNQTGLPLMLEPTPGTLDFGTFGTEASGLHGEGWLAWHSFVVVGEGEADIGFGTISARDSQNQELPIDTDVSTGAPETPVAPRVTALHENVPNPFNPRTTLAFDLARGGKVRLTVYAINGRRVVTLVDRDFAAGRFSVEWNGRDASDRSVASGVYYYRLEAPGYVMTRKMTLLR